MASIDPALFAIDRPVLDRYRLFALGGTIVETYASEAGQMISHGSLHRISINRTAHRRYAHRVGNGAFRRVDRPRFTLGFQPAAVPLEVDGDAAEYISIFQAPEIYRGIADTNFHPEDHADGVLSAVTDPVTLNVALSLAAAVETDLAVPLVIEHLASALAACVARLLGSRAATSPGVLAPQQIRRVIDYIEDHLGNSELSVGELAGVAHLSPFHFSRAFKRATGLAPHRFILERRVETARTQLACGNAPICDIAHASGFSSQAHFSTIFRRLIGTSPGQYRQARRN